METMRKFSGTKEIYANEFNGKMKEAVDVAAIPDVLFLSDSFPLPCKRSVH